MEFYIGAARVADMIPRPVAQGDTIGWSDLSGTNAPLQIGTGLGAVVHRVGDNTYALLSDLMFAKDALGKPDFGAGNLEGCAGPPRPNVDGLSVEDLFGVVESCTSIQDEAAAERQAAVMSVVGDQAMVDAAICFVPEGDGGPKCVALADCRPGETCGVDGVCVIAVRCGQDSECDAGESCLDAVCQVRR